MLKLATKQKKHSDWLTLRVPGQIVGHWTEEKLPHPDPLIFKLLDDK